MGFVLSSVKVLHQSQGLDLCLVCKMETPPCQTPVLRRQQLLSSPPIKGGECYGENLSSGAVCPNRFRTLKNYYSLRNVRENNPTVFSTEDTYWSHFYKQ